MTDTPDPAASPSPAALPANVHAVVYFSAEPREHLDVRILSDASGTAIVGVRADESRAHPITQRVQLGPEELATYTRLIAAISAMPLCEPLARAPDEPTWTFESEAYNDSGPSLWLRDNGAIMLASTDPCLAYARLAHFVYATWMTHFPR